MAIYILETVSSSVKQAAIVVPDPGSRKLKIADITAHVLFTLGTFVIRSHISLSESPTFTTLFLMCSVNLFYMC